MKIPDQLKLLHEVIIHSPVHAVVLCLPIKIHGVVLLLCVNCGRSGDFMVISLTVRVD